MAGSVLREVAPVAVVVLMGAGCTALFDGDELTLADAASDSVAETGADATEDASEPSVKVSGGGTCQVVFVDDAVTCPKTCPSGGGWTVVFDAGDIPASSYAWEITTESGFVVAPVTLDAARAEVRVDIDSAELDCLPDRESLASVRVFAFLAVDGEPTPSDPTATVTLTPQTVNTSQCSAQTECPEP